MFGITEYEVNNYKMRLYILLTVVCSSVVPEITNDVESRLVLTNSGPVRGYKDPQEDVFVFYGIPYAKAPTGTQRFKAPLPSPVWFDILEAVDKGIICPQIQYMDLYSKSKNMKEDCLIANVYIPQTDEKNLPVVVYVHGGAFFMGFGDFVTPKKLVSKEKIVVVTFNYRLGAHGFLCLGTKDIPGNAGMKDQVALLRWVKKNIATFGGNSNDVTIAGYSAGSASVDLLMLSKSAEGLFNKVILESGSSLSPFSVQIDPIENAKEYAKLIEIKNVDDIFELEKHFKEISYEVLQSENLINRKDATFLFSPCVEQDDGQEMWHLSSSDLSSSDLSSSDDGQEIFLKNNPVNILKQGNFSKLPMLYGFANMEGLMRMPNFDIWKKEMNENFANFLPVDLHFKSTDEKNSAVDSIREFYFRDKPVDDNTIFEYIDYMSDIYFTCPTLRAVNHLVKAGHREIFLYQYSYTDENTPVIPKTNMRGANHGSQTDSVLDGFDTNLSKKFYTSEDYIKMKSIMRNLWGNFIVNGRPSSPGTPAWPPVGENWSPHMDLKKNPELMGSLLKERCMFWTKMYDLYYKFPMPPQRLLPKHTEL